jgi:hypothetical protein
VLEAMQAPPEVALAALFHLTVRGAQHRICPAEVRKLMVATIVKVLAEPDDMPADQVH